MPKTCPPWPATSAAPARRCRVPTGTDDRELGGAKAIEARIDKRTLQAVSQLIVERFDPEQVILFGSRARGQAGMHSDVDLLVVRRGEAEKGGAIPFGGPSPRDSCCPSM